MKINYEIKFMHFGVIPEIVSTLKKCGIDCVVTYPSITKGLIQITPREELSMDDVLYVGTLIGQIETLSLK
jgi:hypothetical protein